MDLFYLHSRPLRMLTLIFHSSLLIMFWCIQCPGQTKDKLSALKACERIFGKPFDTHANLFKISSRFVLQIHFDASNNLESLEIIPRYYFHDTHPEWKPDKRPLFSKSQFQSLLNRLENVTQKGKLVWSDSTCFVAINTCPLIDRYEHAYVQKWMTGDKISSFELYPFHEIEGKIIEKGLITSKYLLREPERTIYKVVTGELVYDVEKDEYDKLREGQVQRFFAVGPINGHCVADFCNGLGTIENWIIRSIHFPQ